MNKWEGGCTVLVKIIGSLLIGGAGVYLALALSRYERRRISVLDGYLSLLRYIKGQIDCFASPLSDILAGADPSILSACLGQSPTASDMYAKVRADDGSAPRTFPALPALLKGSHDYLTPEAERLLTAFSAEFGKTFRAEQVSRCDYYLDALTTERQTLSATLPARLRTTTTLCLCLTVASVILLW